MSTKSVWSNERKEIATWLSGYLAMVKKWVDKILDNDDVEVDKNKIIKPYEICRKTSKYLSKESFSGLRGSGYRPEEDPQIPT